MYYKCLLLQFQIDDISLTVLSLNLVVKCIALDRVSNVNSSLVCSKYYSEALT